MPLAHWGWDKMCAISQAMFSNASNQQYIIDSGSGLVPIRQQAIIWTNDGFDHYWCIYVTQPQWVTD